MWQKFLLKITNQRKLSGLSVRKENYDIIIFKFQELSNNVEIHPSHENNADAEGRKHSKLKWVSIVKELKRNNKTNTEILWLNIKAF
jgi:hypothetical protein